MNKLFKSTLSAITGLIMAANLAVVPVFAEGEEPTSTSEVTVYENYNHYIDGNTPQTNYGAYIQKNKGSQDFQGWNNARFTFANFSIPQMDADKLVKAELKLTHKSNAKSNVVLYARHIPESMWRTNYFLSNQALDKETVTVDGVTTTQFHNAAYNTTRANIDALEKTTLATLNITTVGEAITVDITDYIKTQIANGVPHFDINTQLWSENVLFWSASSSGVTDAQKPQVVYTIDTSSFESELSALTADNFKKFINTYYNELGMDYKLVKRINNLSYNAAAMVFNKVAVSDKTADAFGAAVGAAFDGLASSTVTTTAQENVYIDLNSNKTNVTKNISSDMNNVYQNGRVGAFLMPIPEVDAGAIKSVKFVANLTANNKATKPSVIDFNGLDISAISTTTDAATCDVVKKAFASTRVIVPNSATTVTASTAGTYEFDITDYAVEAVKQGRTEMALSLSDLSYSTNTAISTSAKPTLVFEIENASVADEFLSISTAEELDAFMKDADKVSDFGIDNSDYTKFSYPIYLAEYIIEKDYSSVDEFKTVFAEAVAEYTQVVTVEKNKVVFYGASSWSNPLKNRFLITASTDVQSTLARTYHLYDIPATNRIMDGTMSMTMPSARQDTNIGNSIDVIAYTNVANENIPANGEYTYESEEAAKWLEYADTFTKDTLTLDGIGMGIIKTNDVALNEGMIATLNSASGDNGSGYFAVEFAKAGTNIYIRTSTLTLNTDKTEALYIKDSAEKKVLEAADNVSLDDVLKNLTNKELAALGLDLTDYKRFAYGYYVAEEALGASTIEEFKTKLAAGIAKYSTPLTLKAVNNVYYRTGTATDTPMKTGFMAYNTNSSPSYGEVYFQYDLSDINAAIFSGKMYGNNVNANTLVGGNNRTLKLERYSIVSPNLPAKRTGKEDVEFFDKNNVNLYEIGSAEAEAFNTWQTTDANFTTDGKTTFTFKPEFGKVSDTLTISDDLISAINEATAENGSKELMIELEDGANVYSNGITFDLLIDGTVAAYEKDAREQAFLGSIANVADAADMVAYLESYDDILGLSENTAYQKVMDKTVVGQAVMDAWFVNWGFNSVDEVIEVINTTSEANPPTKLMEITAIDYINEPDYDLDTETEGLEGTGYLGTVSIKKYDDLSTTATLITAVYDKATGALVGLKSVDATDAITKAGYGKTVKVNVGGYFVLGNDEEPTTEIKAFVWDSANGMKSLTDVYETDAVTTR